MCSSWNERVRAKFLYLLHVMPRTCSFLAKGKNEESEHDRLCKVKKKLGMKNESGTCSVEREREERSPRKP